MQQQESHYAVLGVGRHAPPDEVKAAYQRRLLSAHPDKAGPAATEGFQRLHYAWQVLREPGSRALYDHQLSQAELRATVVLHDEVALQDMDGSPCAATNGAAGDQQQRTYPCRCGDSYVLTPGDLQLAAQGSSSQLVVPCRSCSNHILVHLPP